MKSTENVNQYKALSDDDLKAVAGGSAYGYGYGAVQFGNWYTTPSQPNHILTPKKMNDGYGNPAFNTTGTIFARYWYDGINAWNHGTCTAVDENDYFYLADAPKAIFDKYTSEMPKSII